MKLGIIGAGNWGSNLIRNFCQICGRENIIVCDTERGKLSRIENGYPGIETTGNFNDILSDNKIDAVVIATPAETHYRLARESLLSGKHTFVEKPITLNVGEAEELVNISEEKELKLMVDHLLKYHPVIEEIKRLIDKGILGDIYYIYSQRLNLGIIRSYENTLWSLGPHDISVYLYLLDEEPDRISATGGVYIQNEKGIEDTVFLHLHFPSGVDAHAHLSWLDPHKKRRLTVVGSDKMVVFDDMEPRNKLTIFDKGVCQAEEGGIGVRYGDIHIPNIQLKEPLKESCNHFLRCIKEDETPRSDGYDGLQVLRILEKAQKSLERSKEV